MAEASEEISSSRFNACNTLLLSFLQRQLFPGFWCLKLFAQATACFTFDT